MGIKDLQFLVSQTQNNCAALRIKRHNDVIVQVNAYHNENLWRYEKAALLLVDQLTTTHFTNIVLPNSPNNIRYAGHLSTSHFININLLFHLVIHQIFHRWMTISTIWLGCLGINIKPNEISLDKVQTERVY
jgi:hypothetical protein